MNFKERSHKIGVRLKFSAYPKQPLFVIGDEIPKYVKKCIRLS